MSFDLMLCRVRIAGREDEPVDMAVATGRVAAVIHRGANGFTVRDVGSLNGTYVNRERVESATLSNSDEVQIGKFRLVFIAGPRLDDVT